MPRGKCLIVLLSFVGGISWVFCLAHSTLADGPEPFKIYNSRAFKLFRQEHYYEAKKAFESDGDAMWQDPEAAYIYAETLLKLGKGTDALNVWKRIIREHPKSNAAKIAKDDIWELKSDYGVLGFKFNVKYGSFPEVEIVFPGTPAERSHIQKQDFIMKIDDVPIVNFTQTRIADLLYGPPDTQVKLTFKRGNAIFTKVLTRMHSKAFARAHPDTWRLYLAPDPYK